MVISKTRIRVFFRNLAQHWIQNNCRTTLIHLEGSCLKILPSSSFLIYPTRSLYNFYTIINKIKWSNKLTLNSSSTCIATVTWCRITVNHEVTWTRPITTWSKLIPFYRSTTDMTKVHAQILRWPLSRFRMEGYPCYCLIEIPVSSKKPRPLNSFHG